MTSTQQERAPKTTDIVAQGVNERFAEVLAGTTMSLAAFEVGVRSALAGNPKLMQIAQQNPASLFQGLSEAAALGLSPDPQLEHFYLIPYGKEVQAQVGYRGLVYLAQLSGQVEDIESEVIYRGEVEELKAQGLRVVDKVTGVPNIDPDDRLLSDIDMSDKAIVGAFATVRLKGIEKQITRVMSVADIEKRRKAGNGNTPAWKGWFEEMAKKTVLKALLRSGRVPLGAHHRRIQAALAAEESDGQPGEEVRQVEATVVRTEPALSIEEIDHQRREDDPLPDEETRRAEVLSDIWMLADRGELSPQTVHAFCMERHGKDVEQASVEALEDLRKSLEAGEVSA